MLQLSCFVFFVVEILLYKCFSEETFDSCIVSDKFTLHTEAKTWEEANAVCVNDGGRLAVKTDLNEQLILNLLGDTSNTLWIGEYYTPWIWLQGYIDRLF